MDGLGKRTKYFLAEKKLNPFFNIPKCFSKLKKKIKKYLIKIKKKLKFSVKKLPLTV